MIKIKRVGFRTPVELPLSGATELTKAWSSDKLEILMDDEQAMVMVRATEKDHAYVVYIPIENVAWWHIDDGNHHTRRGRE